MATDTGIRALSSEEIKAVAGAGSVNTMAVTQSNNATATATSTAGGGVPEQQWHPYGRRTR